MADAYKLLADAAFPKALRREGEDLDGNPTYLTEGRNYVAGSYVFSEDLTPSDREKAENGDFDHLLEAASREDAESYYDVLVRGVFIPEHEAEAVALETYGHEVVPRDQALELNAAGAQAAAEAQEAAFADGAGERPNLTRAEYPALAEVSKGDVENVPAESEPVSEERLAEAPSSSQRGVERPPGVQVGAEKAAQEGEKRGPGRPKGSAKAKPAATEVSAKPKAAPAAQDKQ